MSSDSRLVAQFRQPSGILGRLAGWIMATRGSNRERNFWGAELLEVEPGQRVLELGFGPGVAIERLAGAAAPGEVVGVDHSATMLAQASRRNRAAIACGQVRLLLGSADTLPPGLGKFDRIISANVVMFWRDPAAVFAELHALLAPGGQLATTYQPRHSGATPADAEAMASRIAAWMGEAGFAEIRRERLELKPLPAICVLGRRSGEGAPSGS